MVVSIPFRKGFEPKVQLPPGAGLGLNPFSAQIPFRIVARAEKERLDYVPVTSLGVLLPAVTGLLIALGFVLNW
jgi:hypothetical protein